MRPGRARRRAAERLGPLDREPAAARRGRGGERLRGIPLRQRGRRRVPLRVGRVLRLVPRSREAAAAEPGRGRAARHAAHAGPRPRGDAAPRAPDHSLHHRGALAAGRAARGEEGRNHHAGALPEVAAGKDRRSRGKGSRARQGGGQRRAQPALGDEDPAEAARAALPHRPAERRNGQRDPGARPSGVAPRRRRPSGFRFPGGAGRSPPAHAACRNRRGRRARTAQEGDRPEGGGAGKRQREACQSVLRRPRPGQDRRAGEGPARRIDPNPSKAERAAAEARHVSRARQ